MRKKNWFVANVRQLAVVGSVIGLLSAQAGAQSFNQPVEMPRSQNAPSASPNLPEGTVDRATPAERSLPNIVGTVPQSRQTMDAQRTVRTSKPSGDDSKGPRNAFDLYAETATGSRLELFGKSLFTDVPTTFAPFDTAQVNADYVIGTGDEIQIRGWGMVNIDVTAVVDRNGGIYIPRVGSVKVAGVKYRDLQAYLKQAISKVFSNFELTASISQTRAVQIYVVGHAVRPGTYTLNSMSTLLNALFTSGGPATSGSMRNIQLKRGSAIVTTFDLYDMLVKGDKSRDVSIRDGDVIYIPEVGPLVALTGNVKTPAIFELKGPASLADLVGWAGGIDSAAEQQKVVVEKTVGNVYQTVAQFDAATTSVNSGLASVPVKPTDVFRVFAPGAVPIQARVQNEFVRVSGEVNQSGMLQIRKGETLRELMARLGGVSDMGYLYATQVNRESVRRAQQLKLNEIADRFERDIESAATARVSGSTDKDAIALQASELERQRGVAQKLRTVKAEGRIVLELDDSNAQVKNLPDLPLQDGDSIYVPRKPGTVEVLGAVFQSNSFIYKPHRSVKDYMLLAGGVTESADPSEVYVIRADGTAKSSRGMGWFSGVGGAIVNPGDTIVVPEKIDRSTFRQSLKEWTAIFYQFGLGAAGLKVLKN
ncbi:SLBB domain-containing protein [Massilia sp. R2A-15]|uniref:SLBB domain-containing protein n=1 Tax=Massilia sp. R2A-15 TaxID=3064278 RepID=UPI0027327CB1|nr:SLBB domain-containing protein [Massilia sp. R2A-15]WLI88048.1 SLBB domain-containing protein [Massilia sp. R2A-15]